MDGWELKLESVPIGTLVQGVRSLGIGKRVSLCFPALFYFLLVICSRYYRFELLSGCFSVSHRVLNKYPPRGIIKLKIEPFFLHLEGYGRDLECGVLVVNSASEPVE